MKNLKSHLFFIPALLFIPILVLGLFLMPGAPAKNILSEVKVEAVNTLSSNDKASPSSVDPAIQAGFVPHKALYDVELMSTKSGSQIVNLKGQMLYEWQSSCDAWLANHQFNLLYEYADTAPMQITSDFSTFESFDGKSLDFTSQRKRDGQLFEEIRGHGAISDTDSGEARYSMPEGLAFDLPAGTLFPMRHTLDVFAQIQKGKKFYKATIFDGSDEDGPVEVNAFIGKPVNSMADMQPSANIDTALLNTKAWNVRLAFFPTINPETTADYEMSMTFHENGIISDMKIEYEDFSVRQTLKALEKVEGGCAVNKVSQ